VTSLGAARTTLDGSFALIAKPAVSGTLAIALPGSTAYTATSQVLGDLAVHQATSSMTASVSSNDVGYGTPLAVTGTLQRDAGGTVTGAAAQTVTLRLAAPGRPSVVLVTGRTAADGTFRLAAPAKGSGALSVVFAGVSTLPAASADLGDVTVGTWSTELSAATSASSVIAGRPVSITGTLTRTYGGVTEAAKAVPVKLYYQASNASVRSVLSGVTSASGTFTFKVVPRATTVYEVEVVSVTGHADATSGELTVTVP
jgi:hypothetical protein